MNNKLLMAVIAVAVLFAAAVGGGFFMMWNKLSALDALIRSEEMAEEDAEDGLATIGTLFPLKTFIVNLADSNGKRYLRVTMQIELKEGEPAELLEQRLVQVRDVILMILPTKQFHEIRSVDGKTLLRQEIMTRLNEHLKQDVIQNIYFTEFVVQ